MRAGCFVVTSNVDGQFQKAGFADDRVHEVHGTIHWHQCLRGCGVGIFDAAATEIEVEEATCRAVGPLPLCPSCGGPARPNILMFGDRGWDGERSAAQETRLSGWIDRATDRRLVVIECGAGLAIPTIRRFSEQAARWGGCTLIRINPREPEVPPSGGHLGLAMPARVALQALDEVLTR